MPENLSHLPAPLIFNGIPKLNGSGETPLREILNKDNRLEHSHALTTKGKNANAYWERTKTRREEGQLPKLPIGIPILIQVEPNSNIDYLRTTFDFEIVAEHEDGIVIICAEDTSLETFFEKSQQFKEGTRGSGNSAKIYELWGPENHQVRIKNILDESLYKKWDTLKDDNQYTVEISIECIGVITLPKRPERTDADAGDDQRFERKINRWSEKRNAALEDLDNLLMQREKEIIDFIDGYQGEVHSIFQDVPDIAILPDSFTLIATLSGLGLKDLTLNHPHVFEITEPEPIEEPIQTLEPGDDLPPDLKISPPDEDSARICIIDSGIQENHKLIEHAVDTNASFCFITGESTTDTADYVQPGGHGTRVAGATLFGENIPTEGEHKHPFWIRNARVLNKHNSLHSTTLPASLLGLIVKKYTDELNPPSKIYNHSISASTPFRPSRMSAWAAEMDNLSWEHDVLFIQSTGNVREADNHPSSLGISNQIQAGRDYPNYLLERSSKISNPAQSMHAITVGSVAYDKVIDGTIVSFAEKDHPSSFTRTGLGMWDSVKPDVVEYGGDFSKDANTPPQISLSEEAAPNLIRSNFHTVGPSMAKDAIGTSFSAPKVTNIAGHIQNMFPDESTLLYRSLIGLSARWPAWAEAAANKSDIIRSLGYGIPSTDRALYSNEKRVTLISSGEHEIGDKEGHIYRIPIPDIFRAPGSEYNVRIDVSLAFKAPTRRTRRHSRNYFGTWVDWSSSKTGEDYESFKARSYKDQNPAIDTGEDVFPWMLRERSDWGSIHKTSRSKGSLQKDWAIIPAYKLPEDFCISVVGHSGWDIASVHNAKYSLTISIEAVDTELNIHELISAEVHSLIEAEAETEVLLETS